MKENSESHPESIQRSEPYAAGPGAEAARAASATNANGASTHSAGGAMPKVDFWTALEILAHRWDWLVLGAVLSGAAFFYLAWLVIQPKFTATAQLLRYETPGASDFFRNSQMSPETFTGLIRSPDLMQEVGSNAVPPISAEKLTKLIKIEPQPDSDLVKVSYKARDAKAAVDLLNNFVNKAVKFTLDMQRSQAMRVEQDYLTEQVSNMNSDISSLQQQFTKMGVPGVLTSKLAQVSTNLNALGTHLASPQVSSVVTAQLRQRLEKSLAEYNDLLLKYTDLHPFVQAKKEEIAEIEKQLASAATNTFINSPIASAALLTSGTGPGGALANNNPEADVLRMRLLSLFEGQVQLLNKQREAQLYVKEPPGIARVFAPASLKTVQGNMRWVKISAVTIVGSGFGMVMSLGLVLLVEFTDKRLHNSEDVTRVTKLPVLTTLGDLGKMNDAERAQWAFRAWTMLQGCLSPTPNHGLVCGITSSSTKEGRSTWISLLAEAASLTGFRVLTIATKPSPTHVSPDEPFEESMGESAFDLRVPANNGKAKKAEPPANGNQHSAAAQNGSALAANVLTSPSKVTEQLTGPNSQPVVHIPLPGWVWNLERRKQWREALNHWRSIDNLVILVELPPADVAEAVLLGSNLPNLVWLTHSGKANASETRSQLETLRHARCNLVGAVLNREPAVPLKKRFPRWIGCMVGLLALGLASASAQSNLSSGLRAQPAPSDSATVSKVLLPAANPPAEAVTQTVVPPTQSSPVEAESSTNEEAEPREGSFSIEDPAQRAAWQRHLTLGAADVLNFGLYGAPDLYHPAVSIGSDGRVSYLEAQDVMAAGLTIDQLRDRIDQELSKYRRSPRVIITPVAFRSKRYYIMGKIMTKGVYVLDRPMTVLEAIARAHGFENGLLNRNIVELADLQHSFLARGGKRYPLNFERLFGDGDLSQNIAIEPGDYIYLPPITVKEVYVVGEVRLPGATIYNPNTTIISAIASRGGYTARAYKMRVVVVRGSLDHPQTIVVNTHDILTGKGKDFRLLPRDIVYVNSRPFIRVEEIADLAATAFIQSLITTWVGTDLVKPIQ